MNPLHKIIIADDDVDIRLDRWFKRYRPHVPHGMIEKGLRKGQVRLEGKKVKASVRLSVGQELTFPVEWNNPEQFKEYRPAAPRAGWQPSDEEAEEARGWVLYKDENVLVINKPAGLAVQGGTGLSRNLDAMLDALQFEAKDRPKLVHRLDKDTSGVLILARTTRAAAELSKLFAAKQVEKIYYALIKGMPIPSEGRIALPLAKKAQGKNSKARADTSAYDQPYEKVEIDTDEGLPAETEFRVLDHLSDKMSWVELVPITGRTHQLRVHMAAVGHPIIGDGKYGGSDAFVQGMQLSNKLHLHAGKITIEALFGKRIEVKAPLSEHMKQSVQALGIDVQD